eukprot:gene10408-1887_t
MPACCCHVWRPNADYKVSQNHITLITGDQGRPTGKAYVRFDTAEDATLAHAARDGKSIGSACWRSRWIELFQCTVQTMQQALQPLPTVVRLRGLPFSASIADVEVPSWRADPSDCNSLACIVASWLALGWLHELCTGVLPLQLARINPSRTILLDNLVFTLALSRWDSRPSGEAFVLLTDQTAQEQ